MSLPLLLRNDDVNGVRRRHAWYAILTLRQWALLSSFLIFIITSVITICALLGYIHSGDNVNLLKADIDEERRMKGNRGSNEIVLFLSVYSVIITNCVMTVCFWASCINLICAGILIYGVVTRTRYCVLPWLMVSIFSYAVALFVLLFGHFSVFRNIYVSSTILVIALSSGLLFAGMWHTILRFYRSFSPKPPPTVQVYQAHGGFQHTVIASNQVIPKV